MTLSNFFFSIALVLVSGFWTIPGCDGQYSLLSVHASSEVWQCSGATPLGAQKTMLYGGRDKT